MAFVLSTFTGPSLVSPTSTSAAVYACAAKPSLSPVRRTTRRAMISGAVAAAVAVASANVVMPPAPARADHTEQAARRSYDRYFPRIVEGIDESRAVAVAIQSGDLTAAKEMVTAKTFDIKFRRALNIYATSFSDSSINKQSQELLSCVNGFFASVGKAVNAESSEEAVQDWNKAADAIEAYVRVARLSKLKDMPTLAI